MLIVGERINASRKAIREALADRAAEVIQEEAKRQAEAGADYLDVNGGSRPEEELENMIWLCEVVPAVVDLPLCIDSADPKVVEEGLKRHPKGRPFVNSVSLEKSRVENIFPLVQKYQAKVVALAMDDTGIPRTSEDRLRVVEGLVQAGQKFGVPLSDIYVDPLVMALSADTSAGKMVIDVLRGIRQRWPELKTTCGLSNISFGLPHRKLLNRTFLALLLAHGLDSAILDPLDQDLMATLTAGRALLGEDEFCMNYLQAFRAGKLKT